MELVDVIAAETVAAEAALAAAESQLAALREMAVLAARLEKVAPESNGAPASSQRRTRERPAASTRRAAAQNGAGPEAAALRARVLEMVRAAGDGGVAQADAAQRLGVKTERVRSAAAHLQREGLVAQRGQRVGQGGGRPSAVLVPVNGQQPAAAPASKAPATLDGRVLVSLIAPKYGAEVANELGVSIAELSPVLERLKDEGEVRRCEGGKWEAVR